MYVLKVKNPSKLQFYKLVYALPMQNSTDESEVFKKVWFATAKYYKVQF